MNKIMTADEFVDRLIETTKLNTVYATGGWGACSNFKENKTKYAKRTPFNADDILNAPADTFYFDCVCMVKGILWGFTGDPTKKYGGAEYASNGVGDYSIERITKMCDTYSRNFDNIQKGEWLNLNAEHCGIYIGNGRAIECTPIWEDGVQITGVQNTGNFGYHSRHWDGHGQLPYIEYNGRSDVLNVDGYFGSNTAYYSALLFGVNPTGKIKDQPKKNKPYLPNAVKSIWEFKDEEDLTEGDPVIYALQMMLHEKGYYNDLIDGFCGYFTVQALQHYLADEKYYDNRLDGYMGYYTVCAWQSYVNYHYQLLEISQ